VKSLVIESAFTSTKDMAKSMASSACSLPCFRQTTITSKRSVAFPFRSSSFTGTGMKSFSPWREVVRSRRRSKFFRPVKGAGHNDVFIVGGEEYFRVFAEFAEKRQDSRTIASIDLTS